MQDKKGRDLTKPDEKESADENYKNFKEMSELLALHNLLSENDLTKLLSKKEIEKIDSWIQDIKNGKWNQGIVDQTIDNKAHFTHLTFAEYFASFPLVEKMFQDYTLLYINNILANASPVFINSIIKQLDNKQTEMAVLLKGKALLNLAAKEGYLNFVKALLEAGYDNFPKADNLDKTPLHYAAEYSHANIVKYLLDYNNDILFIYFILFI